MKLRLLDLCCKAGGCSVGYYRAAKAAGIDLTIIGVDIEKQPNYPFTFIQADAVEFLKLYGADFDIIHASPPCQAYTPSTAERRKKGKVYPEIIDPIRYLMNLLGKPGIIENVPASPVRPDIVLRGDMFGLKVIRKRHFECINWFSLTPQLPKIKRGAILTGEYICVFGHASWKRVSVSATKKVGVIPTWRKDTIRETWAFAMGIDWHMKDVELAEAIPPAYTEYIGDELFRQFLAR